MRCSQRCAVLLKTHSSGLWHCRWVSSSWCCGRSLCLRLLGIIDCLTPEDGGNIPWNVTKHSPKDTVSLHRWPESSFERNIHLIAHLPKLNVRIPLSLVTFIRYQWNCEVIPSREIKHLMQEHCTGVSRRCARVFRERKKGILLSRTLYGSNWHLLNKRVYCRCSKSPPWAVWHCLRRARCQGATKTAAGTAAQGRSSSGDSFCSAAGCLTFTCPPSLHLKHISRPSITTSTWIYAARNSINPPPFWLLESWEKILWCHVRFRSHYA